MIAAVKLRYEPVETDMAEVRNILLSHGIFRLNEVAVAQELVADRLLKKEKSEYHFVFADANGQLEGFCCFGPIAVTVSSYDLYWIAVRFGAGRSGVGRAMLNEVVRIARSAGATQIFAETSSMPDYRAAHRFYMQNGFIQHAEVPDFYASGDSKLILGRKL